MKYLPIILSLTMWSSGVHPVDWISHVKPSIRHIVAYSAHRAGVNPSIMNAICYIESGDKPSLVHHADGNSSSYGLCQIKLGTARVLGFKGKKSELMDPWVNSYYAARILRYHLDQYGNYKAAVQAYNTGRYDGWLGEYVRKVMKVADAY